MYFKSGLYSGQIQRYIDLFRDNVLIIDFVDFKDNPCSEYKNICNFLEIEPIEPPNETHNLSKKVLSSSLQFVLRKVTYDFIAETIQGEKPKNFSKSYMCSFLKNSWKFYKFSRRMPHLTHAWTAFSRFREEISKTNYRYDPAEKKEQRDFLLKLGIEPGTPPLVRVETKKNLLNLYRDDSQKLEKSLNRSFEHWS